VSRLGAKIKVKMNSLELFSIQLILAGKLRKVQIDFKKLIIWTVNSKSIL